MNKQFMYVNDTIIVSNEDGIKSVIPYVDNIEDILILENEIEYLKKCLKKDEKALKDATNDVAIKNRDSKCISIFGPIIAIGATLGAAQIFGLSHEEVKNTIFGPMSEYLAFSIPMSCGLVIGTQVFSLYGLSTRPSKSSIAGLEERIKFEKGMISVFNDELNLLKKNTTTERMGVDREKVRYDVHYKFVLDYLKEALDLRYAFGCNPERFVELFNVGFLEEQLTDDGFSDDVIMDFYEYVKAYLIEQKKVNKKM